MLLSTTVLADKAKREEAIQFLKNDENGKAAEIYEELASNGDDQAKFAIALFYEHGIHYKRDVEKAISIYKSLCENYVEPCNRLGEAYISLSQYDLAESAYLKAANSGDLRAYGNLRILYDNRKWVKYDSNAAKTWNQKLIDADWEAYDQREGLTEHDFSSEPKN